MKIITNAVIVLLLLSTDVICAEIIRKEIINPNGTTEFIFYSGGKEVAKQVVDEDANLVKNVGKIPDGTVSEYYKSGELRFEFNYKNGKYEGISREYYNSGKLSAETNFKNGIRDGISKEFYESGAVKKEAQYINNKLEWVKEYYERGKLKRVWGYKAGKREGMTRGYYESGKLSGEVNFKDDKLDGISKLYYENGMLKQVDTYKNGKVIGRKAYNINGEPECEQDFSVDDKDRK